jgi:Spy/CpxP family protein refolding chaperone
MDPNANPEPAAPTSRTCGRGRARLAIAGVLLAGAAIGAVTTKAFSHGFMGRHHSPPGLAMLAAAPGPIDPAAVDEHAGRMARHFGVEVDATKDQQDKLTAIVRAAAKDLLPYRDKMQASRKQGVDLLTAATVDKDALEKLRAEQLANMEVVSKRISQALAESAEVLTPEQRKKLAERIEHFREHRGWGPWRRG